MTIDFEVSLTSQVANTNIVENLAQKIANLTNQANTIMSDLNTAKASIQQLVAKAQNVFHYKGTVATIADLPASAEVGDTYNVESNKANYAWSGTAWDDLGGVGDLMEMTTEEVKEIMGV